MKHIGIDARFFGSAHGGIGRYVMEVVRACAKKDAGDFRFTLLLLKGTIMPFPLGDHINVVYTDVMWYTLREQYSLPKIYAQIGADFWHFPHWNVPLFPRVPFVLTFHDAIMFRFPRRDASTHGLFVYALKTVAAFFVAFMALFRARSISVTSEYVLEEARRLFLVPRKKMTVIYQAPGTIPAPEGEDALPVSRPYALCVGSAFPHKNIPRLLRAWSVALPNLPDNAQLVVCGPKHVFFDRLCNDFASTPRVVFLPGVSDQMLSTLYAYAHLFVFPSLSEGFGIPPLEAMRAGAPVLSSDAPCMKEVLGDAAYFMKREDEFNMAQSIQDLWWDGGLLNSLRERGYARVEKFSFDSFAESLFSFYQNKASERFS